jgi:plasmid stabilization system protein ParE
MAYILRWSERAAEDLRELLQYLSQHDPDIARSLAERIVAKLDATTAFPLSGRIVPEKGDPAIREVILSPYRLVYFVDEGKEAIFVVRLWHAARGAPEI